jgi:hypothetical protein
VTVVFSEEDLLMRIVNAHIIAAKRILPDNVCTKAQISVEKHLRDNRNTGSLIAVSKLLSDHHMQQIL